VLLLLQLRQKVLEEERLRKEQEEEEAKAQVCTAFVIIGYMSCMM